jgi:hypothetical protein
MVLLFTTSVPVKLKYSNQKLNTMNYKTLMLVTEISVTQTVIILYGHW